MGTSWSVRLVPPASGLPRAVPDEIAVTLANIVGEMSHWEPESSLGRFNRAPAGQWHSIPPALSHVLATAEKVGKLSEGAFDPGAGRLADLWGFGPSGRRDAPPADVEIAALADRRIEHDPPLLRARRTASAALDFSGIAKGYAVDRVAERLRAIGIADFLVEIGGELLGAGVKPDGQPWWVEIEPAEGAAPIRVALHGLAIATSADSQRWFEHAGRRYAHTLAPRTGRPVDNGVASVSVLHPCCMLADAWATALTVLGPPGMALAEREGLAVQMTVREAQAARELLSPALAAMLG